MLCGREFQTTASQVERNDNVYYDEYASIRCRSAAVVKPPYHALAQLGDDDRAENSLQRGVVHSMAT